METKNEKINLWFESLTGKIFLVKDVENFKTLKDLRRELSNEVSIPIEELKIICAGKRLDNSVYDNTPLSKIKVFSSEHHKEMPFLEVAKNLATLHIESKKEEKSAPLMRIFINVKIANEWKELSIEDISPNMTADNLKDKLKERYPNIKEDSYNLIFASKRLEDTRPLSDYNISDGAKIYTEFRLGPPIADAYQEEATLYKTEAASYREKLEKIKNSLFYVSKPRLLVSSAVVMAFAVVFAIAAGLLATTGVGAVILFGLMAAACVGLSLFAAYKSIKIGKGGGGGSSSEALPDEPEKSNRSQKQNITVKREVTQTSDRSYKKGDVLGQQPQIPLSPAQVQTPGQEKTDPKNTPEV